MIFIVGYFFLIILELAFVSTFLAYTLSLIYSSLNGSPYVPTRGREIDLIFQEIKPKKGAYFVDLGCGDGRIVRHAVGKYKLKGLGIDINPLLTFYSRILSRIKNLKNISFKRHNLFDRILVEDLRKADYIYLFLMPKLLDKLAPHLVKNSKKGSIIISHGFKIEAFNKKLIRKLDRTPFPTYYYKVE